MFILYLLKSLSSFTDYKITRRKHRKPQKTGKGRLRKNTGIVLEAKRKNYDTLIQIEKCPKYTYLKRFGHFFYYLVLQIG